jgi:GGDEF domain-containing protein
MAVDHPVMDRDIDLSALNDPLTGLPSARVWGDSVVWAVEHGRDTAGHLTVALIDVERFVPYAEADPLGGDRLIKGIAAEWYTALDDAGLLSRLFNGRFGLLLPSQGLEAALDTIEGLRERVPAPWRTTVGVAVWEGETAHVLTSRADGALTGAKLHGRDRAVVAC